MGPEKEPQESKKPENPNTSPCTRFAIQTQKHPKRKASTVFDEHSPRQPKRRLQKLPNILDRKLRKVQSLSKKHRKLTGKRDICSTRLQTNTGIPEGFYQMSDQQKLEYLDQEISELSRKIRAAEEPSLEQIMEHLET